MSIIDSLVKEYWETEFPQMRRRDDIIDTLPEPATFNTVRIITGMRRCGKTFYLFQLMSDLVEFGVPRKRIFYFDFSDDRLKPMKAGIGAETIEAYYRMVPEARFEGAYLFLDEIQELVDWQALCSRLAAREKVTLVVTGSSSKLSSDEIATNFRGRSQSHEMMPLSFLEYCRFNDAEIEVQPQGNAVYSQAEQTELEGLYEKHLIEGGFPGVQRIRGITRKEATNILQGYVRDVVARDVVERLGGGDIVLANAIALYALRNTACEYAVSSAVKALRADEMTAYWKKADSILRLLEQAFLFHRVPEFSMGIKESTTSVPKVYANDPGLTWAVSRASQQDVGKRLETAVYLELRRRLVGSRIDTVSSYSCRNDSGKKVDFIVGDALADDPYELIQVCTDMGSERTRKREVTSLAAAMGETGLDHGMIITLREEGIIECAEGEIEVIPAWRWSLQR